VLSKASSDWTRFWLRATGIGVGTQHLEGAVGCSGTQLDWDRAIDDSVMIGIFLDGSCTGAGVPVYSGPPRTDDGHLILKIGNHQI
jgi:hypothetical protein